MLRNANTPLPAPIGGGWHEPIPTLTGSPGAAAQPHRDSATRLASTGSTSRLPPAAKVPGLFRCVWVELSAPQVDAQGDGGSS
ncbi:uncharacterized protein P884DRAFT_122015 [Thermothelomyces heterothallicus CBS 202.75]|uniref:uncharacterized protein n=1 Tax=Thermothelomyces heterothallicus CBS 202.75 TaxID=1149848 RepID=UPI0037432719